MSDGKMSSEDVAFALRLAGEARPVAEAMLRRHIAALEKEAVHHRGQVEVLMRQRDQYRDDLEALEKERDRMLTDWREYKASKDADVAAWKTKADATADERDAALADNAAKDKAFGEYVAMWGVQHGDIQGTETTCPEDDTCECPHIAALNAAFGPGHPGAALLEEHRKAVVRVRNEGLEKAARETDAEADEWDGAAAHDGDPVSHEANAIRGAARRIRAMKEPES